MTTETREQEDRMVTGSGIAPGVAQGILRFFVPAPQARRDPVVPGEPETEIERFAQHVGSLIEDLREMVARLGEDSASPGADILRSHILLLEGSSLRSRIEETIRSTNLAAEAAVEHAIEEIVRVFEGSGNPVLVERAPDLRDLAIQLRQRLAGQQASLLAGLPQDPSECILATRELLPSLVLEAHARGVRGFVVDRGTPLSHGAILAQSFDLPVLRVPRLEALWSLDGSRVLLDADRGELLVEPAAADLEPRLAEAPPVPVPGPAPSSLARVWLNVMDPGQLVGVDWTGVEGVGLYRTEMLFLGRRGGMPGEEEQTEAYRRLFERCAPGRATVRTLDIGGDKALPYFSLGPQDNPALGLRAHRIYRFHPEILLTQVRAILRAAAGFPGLRLLFPMIECVEEWRFVQGLVDQAVDSLAAEGTAFQERFERGVLVETPSAAWSFRRLLEAADFASIGTNDLIQYLFAVDRSNPNVLRTYGPEHPVVLQVLAALARDAKEAGKPLSICGKAGSDLALLPALIGLGITDLSVPVNRAQAVRARLATLRPRDCRRLARQCLQAETPDEVLELLGRPGSPPGPGVVAPRGAEWVDPVCGMAVHAEGNPLTTVRDGRRFYFCSRECLDAFLRQPADPANQTR
ncbi:putative PEP-binding protein [Deferrisoma camini]|uniref:putative PEP-binding protein n=1 Tax=Deferrisoma camini TaxID=1035120 RepID=UPI000A0274DC|nr:putative PEP-binding protein [Deferrisoma camini]